ncbi:MAG: hypothetical protein QXZ12_08180 [Thermoplasmata archaeon]
MIVAVMQFTSYGTHIIPASPVTYGKDPLLDVTSGVLDVIASSIIGIPNPSKRDGKTNISEILYKFVRPCVDKLAS